MSHNIRKEWCRVCGGDGGWPPEYPGQSWLRCVACDGLGEIEFELTPVTIADFTD